MVVVVPSKAWDLDEMVCKVVLPFFFPAVDVKHVKEKKSITDD